MAEAKFKIGDRVRVIKETGGHHAKMGMTGTVIYFERYLNGVRFDEEFEDGHSLGGRCESGHGQWMKDTDIELIDGHKDDHKIVITTDGKNTLARLYENGKVTKTAEAKCSPSDTFDFETGAKLAFERLTAKAEYDYQKAYDILEKYCSGVKCDDCTIKKYAKSKGMERCTHIVTFGDICNKEYTPEYLDNLISELEKFEAEEKADKVHRKAKKGEYVKLITHGGYGDAYEVGGIYKVEKTVADCVKLRSKDDMHLLNFLPHEYVVLEGYEPEEKPKYYNGKVVCVEKDKGYFAYTVGKVYEFIDGKVKIDNGTLQPTGRAIKSLDEWNNDSNTMGKFIELKE